ncbi:MAG: hypothetical protein WBV39_12685, partial [Rudaea sp.]
VLGRYFGFVYAFVSARIAAAFFLRAPGTGKRWKSGALKPALAAQKRGGSRPADALLMRSGKTQLLIIS